MDNVVIVAGCRTAIGSFGGSLKDISASDLGGLVIKEALRRANISPELVEEVVFGSVGQWAENAFVARIASVKGGIPYHAGAVTINRLCSSGLQSIVTAMHEIKAGFCNIAVAGGTENMSRFPYYVRDARFGYRMGDGVLEDAVVSALTDPFSRKHMGTTADNVARMFKVSRKEQDEFALMSQERAAFARAEGLFKDQITPVEVQVSRKESRIFDEDEHIRTTTTLEKLSSLQPAFEKTGTVTAGNSSGINDGAAAVVLMLESKAKELNLKPLARIVDSTVAGVNPSIMGIGPVDAVNKLVKKAGISLDDIGLIELNEAFAAQAIACINELELDIERVNVNGGGISMGHPVGATGCIISIKLISEMMKRDVRYGIATLCIGGGQGLAVLYELYD